MDLTHSVSVVIPMASLEDHDRRQHRVRPPISGLQSDRTMYAACTEHQRRRERQRQSPYERVPSDVQFKSERETQSPDRARCIAILWELHRLGKDGWLRLLKLVVCDADHSATEMCLASTCWKYITQVAKYSGRVWLRYVGHRMPALAAPNEG